MKMVDEKLKMTADTFYLSQFIEYIAAEPITFSNFLPMIKFVNMSTRQIMQTQNLYKRFF